MKTLTIGVLASLILAGCGGSSGVPEITDIRVGEPTGPHGALYFTATSGGPSDRLLSASTHAARSVVLHQTIVDDQGVASMETLDELHLPSGGRLVLEPGGLHLMLIDVDRLEIGDLIEITLTWETAGRIEVTAAVVSPAQTPNGEGH